MRRALPLVFLALGAACSDAPAGPPRSVLLVTLDTTRPDHLSCYGYVRPTTPALDGLAARGALFETCIAQAPETGPSLASALTSRSPPATGVRGNAERLPEDLPTLATAARSSGLRTAAFVSSAILWDRVTGFGRGFQTYDDEMTDPCFGHPRAQRVAERTVDRALEWLAGAEGRPFLLWVHLYDPHGPYTPPAATPRLDATAHLPASEPLLAAWIPKYQRVGASLDRRDYVDRHDREIAYLDDHLGRLLSAVDLRDTVVAVHADHGEALGEDGYWFRHGSLLHDAALRVPLLFAGPGIRAGARLGGSVRNLDLAPTLLSLAGLPALPDAEGADLAPALRGEAAPPDLAAFAEARRREGVSDATGIDTRWKVRLRRPGGSGGTLWPATGEYAGDEERRAEVVAAIRAWLEEPARAAAPASAPSPPPDLPDALRGLGYR